MATREEVEIVLKTSFDSGDVKRGADQAISSTEKMEDGFKRAGRSTGELEDSFERVGDEATKAASSIDSAASNIVNSLDRADNAADDLASSLKQTGGSVKDVTVDTEDLGSAFAITGAAGGAFGTVLSKVSKKALGVAAAVAGVAKTVWEITESIQEGEKAVDRYRGALSNIEVATEASASEMEILNRIISELAAASGEGGDEIAHYVARFTSLGISQQEAIKATTAGLNLAKNEGKETRVVMDAILDTYKGSAEQAIQQGIAVAGLTQEQLKQGEAVRNIEDTYGEILSVTQEVGVVEAERARVQAEIEELQHEIYNSSTNIRNAWNGVLLLIAKVKKFLFETLAGLIEFLNDTVAIVINWEATLAFIAASVDVMFLNMKKGFFVVIDEMVGFAIDKLGWLFRFLGIEFVDNLKETVVGAITEIDSSLTLAKKARGLAAIEATKPITFGIAPSDAPTPEDVGGLSDVDRRPTPLEKESKKADKKAKEKKEKPERRRADKIRGPIRLDETDQVEFLDTTLTVKIPELSPGSAFMTALVGLPGDILSAANTGVSGFKTSDQLRDLGDGTLEQKRAILSNSQISEAAATSISGGFIGAGVEDFQAQMKAQDDALKANAATLADAAKRADEQVIQSRKRIDEQLTKIEDAEIALANAQAELAVADESGRAGALEKVKDAEQGSFAAGQQLEVFKDEAGRFASKAAGVQKRADQAQSDAEQTGGLISQALGNPLVVGGFQELFKLLLQDPEQTKAFFENLTNGFTIMLEKITQNLGPVLKAIIRAIPPIIKAIIKAIPPLIKAIGELIPEIINILVTEIIPLLITDIIPAINDAIIQIFTTVISQVYNTIVNFVKSIFEGGISGFLNTLGTLLKDLFAGSLLGRLLGFQTSSEEAAGLGGPPRPDADNPITNLAQQNEVKSDIRRLELDKGGAGTDEPGRELDFTELTDEDFASVRRTDDITTSAEAFNPYLNEDARKPKQPIKIQIQIGDQELRSVFTEITEAGSPVLVSI